MNIDDIAYTEWKVKNENKFHILDINLCKSKVEVENKKVTTYKLNFNCLNANIKLRVSTDSLFLKYLPSIYNFFESVNNFYSSNSLKSRYLRNLNFNNLFEIRKDFKLSLKKYNLPLPAVRFIIKNEIYIDKNMYIYIQKKLETLNFFLENEKNRELTIDTFENIYDLLNNIIIPYKVESIEEYHSCSIFKLLAITDFCKYFFKENSNFKEMV